MFIFSSLKETIKDLWPYRGNVQAYKSTHWGVKSASAIQLDDFQRIQRGYTESIYSQIRHRKWHSKNILKLVKLDQLSWRVLLCNFVKDFPGCLLPKWIHCSRYGAIILSLQVLMVCFSDVSAEFQTGNGLCPRYSFWFDVITDWPLRHLCKGEIKRYMCHFVLHDLPRIYSKNDSCLFINKFDPEVTGTAGALHCLHSKLVNP